MVSRDFKEPRQASSSETAALDSVRDDVRVRSRGATLRVVLEGMLARRQRARYFKARFFSDPAWDMLLELYAASLSDRRLTVSRLTQRSGVQMTTALRWINTFQQEGLLIRQDHPLDKRLVYLSLTKAGIQAMDAYFEDLIPDAKLI